MGWGLVTNYSPSYNPFHWYNNYSPCEQLSKNLLISFFKCQKVQTNSYLAKIPTNSRKYQRSLSRISAFRQLQLSLLPTQYGSESSFTPRMNWQSAELKIKNSLGTWRIRTTWWPYMESGCILLNCGKWGRSRTGCGPHGEDSVSLSNGQFPYIVKYTFTI